MASDPARLVKQAVAQPLELPRARLLGEAELPGPRDEVLGELNEPQPHLVVREAAEREVGQAAVLGLADTVLDAGVPAVLKIEPGNMSAGLVGEEHRQAVAVVIGERLLVALFELRAPRDQPRALRPCRELDVVGDLAYLRVLALGSV